MTAKPTRLQVWQWNAARLEKVADTPVEVNLNAVWYGEGQYAISPVRSPQADNPLFFFTEGREPPIERWALGPFWYWMILAPSSNGWFLGGLAQEDLATVMNASEAGTSRPTVDFHHPQVRVALIDVHTQELRWLPTLVGTDAGSHGNLRSIVPANDGSTVGVAGWNGGVVFIDAVRKKIQWQGTPASDDTLYYLALSPDGKTGYAGGTNGCVYALDCQTGRELSRWWCTDSGKPVYASRISQIGTSPDGRLVAAGVAPTGRVYIWDVMTGQKVKVCETGASAVHVLAFSPDSKHMAVHAGGSITVWQCDR